MSAAKQAVAAPPSAAELKVEPARRYDAGKPRYELIPADALDELAKVYTAGAAKYADRNWERGMSWSRCFGSLMRHAWAFWAGESHDVETGCHHMAMAAWNCFALVAYSRRGAGCDDRPTNATPPLPADAVPVADPVAERGQKSQKRGRSGRI